MEGLYDDLNTPKVIAELNVFYLIKSINADEERERKNKI